MMNPDINLQEMLSKRTTRNDRNELKQSHVELHEMRSFVHTWVSETDQPPTMNYRRGEIADDTKAKIMNAILQKSKRTGRWAFKDILAKEQAARCGRAIIYYDTFKDENGKFAEKMSLISEYDYLIDPNAGGCYSEEEGDLSLDSARYQGFWNTKITRAKLKAGIKSGIYYKEATEQILLGKNKTTNDQDAVKITISDKERLDDDNVFIFYTWFMMDEKDEMIKLIFDESFRCISAEPLKVTNKEGHVPIASWAAFPDPQEFWSPAVCDYVRNLFVVKEKSINQMLDNAEKINDPQKVINTHGIKNPEQVQYGSKVITVSEEMRVSDAYMSVPTPGIETPIQVYDKMDSISQSQSGVTAAVQGTTTEDVVGVYEGNLEQASKRFALVNKSYTEAYYRICMLHKAGVKQHLNKKQAVEIIGVEGLEIKEVTSSDLFRNGVDYDIEIESTTAEAQLTRIEKREKIAYVQAVLPVMAKNDPKRTLMLAEEWAKLVGYDEDTIRRVYTATELGEERVQSQVNEAFQVLLDMGKPQEYRRYTSSFANELNFMWGRYAHTLTAKQEAHISQYMKFVMERVREDMAQAVSQQTNNQLLEAVNSPIVPQPVQGGAPEEQAPALAQLEEGLV